MMLMYAHRPACIISIRKYLSLSEIITYPIRAVILKMYSTVNIYKVAGTTDLTLAP